MHQRLFTCTFVTDTEFLLSMNNRNLPYDCIKDTSKITQSIIHEHKYL